MEITLQKTSILSSCPACAKRLKSDLDWATHSPPAHVPFLKNRVSICSLRKGKKIFKSTSQLFLQTELAGFCNIGDRTVRIVTSKLMIPWTLRNCSFFSLYTSVSCSGCIVHNSPKPTSSCPACHSGVPFYPLSSAAWKGAKHSAELTNGTAHNKEK